MPGGSKVADLILRSAAFRCDGQKNRGPTKQVRATRRGTIHLDVRPTRRSATASFKSPSRMSKRAPYPRVTAQFFADAAHGLAGEGAAGLSATWRRGRSYF